MRRFFKALLALLLCGLVAAASAQPELSAEQAQRDLTLLQRAFTALHPGLYRYASPAQIDAEFTAAKAAVAQGASRRQLYMLATRLAAAVRCGHTWTNPSNLSPALAETLFGGATQLPLALRQVEGRFLVTASAVPGLGLGSELLSIDGRKSVELIAALMPYLRADGSSDGKRLAQLDDDANGGAMQRLFPLLFPPTAGQYRLKVRDVAGERELTVPALTAAQRAASLPALASADWTFSITGDTALLTLPTFAFWNSSFDGPGFLNRAFKTLAERQTPFLIIDLRDNEGGNDGLGRALMSHLLRQTFTVLGGRRESAYERVPYGLARHLDTWDFGFFDRTGQVTRESGARNWRLVDSAPLTIEPTAQPYAGRVIALVGPQNSSAGFLLARDLQRSRSAVLVGQPTGGNLRGLNGGQLAWITLPASGVAVDIPLLAHFAPGAPPDAGVQPDVMVPHRFADAAAGVDADMRAAQALIEGWRKGLN